MASSETIPDTQSNAQKDLAGLSITSASIARQLDATAFSANGVLVRTAEASAAAVDLARVLASLTDAADAGLAMINGSVSSIGEKLERQMEMRRSESAGTWIVKAVGATVFGGGWCRGCMRVSARQIADASLWCGFNSRSGRRRGAARETCIIPPVAVGAGARLDSRPGWIFGAVCEIRRLAWG